MITKIKNDLERISNFDPRMWKLLRAKKIFGTGCTGFIGTWLIHTFNYLNEKYHLNSSLTLLTREPSKYEGKFGPSVHFIQGNVIDFDFPVGNFDFVIHGATEVSTYQKGNNPSGLLDVSYLGTKRVIEFSTFSNVSKILFLSSGAAYGPQPLDLPRLDESFIGAPSTNNLKSNYGEAKRLGEILLFNQNIAATSARIFAISGQFLPVNSEFAFSNFLEACLLGKNIQIKSNGKATRSYLDASDLTLWLWVLLLKGRDKEIYNVGSEEEISIYDLANLIKVTTKSMVDINILGVEENFDRYIPTNFKIKNEFRLATQVSLEDSITKSFDFLKGNYAV